MASISVQKLASQESADPCPDREQLLIFANSVLPQAERNGFELTILTVEVTFDDMPKEFRAAFFSDQISGRIRGSVRQGDFVAQTGIGEFVVILTAECTLADGAAIATRLQTAVTKPLTQTGRPIIPSCAIGITTTRDDLLDAERVLRNSSMALTQAKGMGANHIKYFSVATQSKIDRHNFVSSGLDAAFDDGAIVPWFQPQIDLANGALTGFEALVRWEHPQKGILGPVDFLDVAEQTGQIEKIGEVMLTGSLSALGTWDRLGLNVPRVAVNLSSAQLNNPCLVDLMKWELDRLDIKPDRLTIKILETVLGTGDKGIVARNLRGLKLVGVQVDLDDFGTGNASVVNIRRFGVHRIKIDRTFIKGIDYDLEQQKITSAMIIMAKALDVQVLAEGVETKAEMDTLRRMDCQFMQGFGLARPMPADAVPAWLQSRAGLQKSARSRS